MARAWCLRAQPRATACALLALLSFSLSTASPLPVGSPPAALMGSGGDSVGGAAPIDASWADSAVATPPGPITHFVQRAGTQFVIALPGVNGSVCQPFNFVGFNTFWLMLRASDPRSRNDVLEVLDKAASLGLTVLRTWAFSDGPDSYRALQRAPGQYNNHTFEGLDFVISQAGARGIRTLLTFGNYWQQYGGVDQYNVWSFEAGHGSCNGAFVCRDAFFNDTFARALYKAHIKAVMTRVNVFTGVAYRDDPAIFGFDLMNEARSSADLYTVERRASSGPLYNITYNSGETLHAWTVEMAAFAKALDPVHLLTSGSEGFFGPSTPLYQYANPGAWASLLGVDFVRHHSVPGIDFAAFHTYVDQWLCTERGSTRAGQLDFFRSWTDAHIQAAEEELQMPVILEEFGGKLAGGARADLYAAAFDAFAASARRGGAAGGVLFWDLYHSAYEKLDRYGGGYGNFLPPTSPAAAGVLAQIGRHAALIARLNAERAADEASCYWAPPLPLGDGCASLSPRLQLGAMPWNCLPGEPENVNSCAPPGSAAALFRNPPPQWRGKGNGSELPVNAVEALVMGSLVNGGRRRINLRGAWLVVPFSRGVQTKYEGEWIRITDPNADITRFCWFAARFTSPAPGAGLAQPYSGDLCRSGALQLSFTRHEWPAGTKRDRGLNISFAGDVWLEAGEALNAGSGGKEVLISFKAGLNASSSLRLDVSSLALAGALSCPSDPAPPPPPPPRAAACPHPWRACAQPLDWAVPLRASPAAAARAASAAGSSAGPTLPVVSSASKPLQLGERLLPGQQYYITARVRIAGLAPGGGGTRAHLRNGSGVALDGGGGGDTVAASAAPNPDEHFTARVAQGVRVQLLLRWRALVAPHGARVSVLAAAEAPLNGSWATLRGVFEFEEDPGPMARSDGRLLPDAQLSAEAAAAGLALELSDVQLRAPWALPANETLPYVPCQLDPAYAPDAVIALPPQPADYQADVRLCSAGYDQSLRVYDDAGALVAASDGPGGGGRAEALLGVRFAAGRRYTLVLDGALGTPYGSDRGGCGLRLTRSDGAAAPLGGGLYDARPSPADAARFVRPAPRGTANASRAFLLGCDPFAYVGANTFDLMDTARYPNLRYLVDRRLDDMSSRGLTVGRTWGFSLGTGESLVQRQAGLQLRPGVYDESVFRGLDYALVQARARGIKLIVALEDYWLSVSRYIAWSPTAGTKTDFYTDWNIRQMYKAHLRFFVARVNTISNVTYRDDPTIFAWNLINEPRCTGCGWALQAWVEEMSQYMKAIDPHHMVTIGEEGFYSSTCERVHLNPGAGKRRTGIASSPWALEEGQDFVGNHASPDIDFATLHAWPDNWMGFADYSPVNSNQAFDYSYGSEVWREKLSYLRDWLQAHAEDAAALGKPLIVEEFGKAIPASFIYDSHFLQSGESVQNDLTLRDLFFKTVYEFVENSALSGGPVGGSNFWVLYRADGQGSIDPYRVTVADKSTMQVVNDHKWNLQQKAGAAPRLCPLGANRSALGRMVADDGRFLDTSVVRMEARGSDAGNSPAERVPDAATAARVAEETTRTLSVAYAARAAVAAAPAAHPQSPDASPPRAPAPAPAPSPTSQTPAESSSAPAAAPPDGKPTSVSLRTPPSSVAVEAGNVSTGRSTAEQPSNGDAWWSRFTTSRGR